MNRNFVNAAHHDGKKVYAWTANDEDVMTRMIFLWRRWYHYRSAQSTE